MPHMPTLRVVHLERIRRHEEIDPLRVDRLVGRIQSDAIQVNPIVCCPAQSGELVVLDGATRTESLQRIGLQHGVVQIVDPATVTLETWHHVVRGCSPQDLLAAIESNDQLRLGPAAKPPTIHAKGGEARLVLGHDLSPNATLSALVSSYVGRWTVSRATDPRLESIARTFPDWAGVAEFPTLTMDDVMSAAVTHDLLPAGITRFLVPERALRLNVPMELLATDKPATDKQAELDAMLEQRANEGRVRRYEETVFVLDD